VVGEKEDKYIAPFIFKSLFNSPRLAIPKRQFFALSVDVTAVILKVGQVAPKDSLNEQGCTLLDRILQALIMYLLCKLGLLFLAQLLEAFKARLICDL
jgi:hypothetical protein